MVGPHTTHTRRLRQVASDVYYLIDSLDINDPQVLLFWCAIELRVSKRILDP